LVVNNCSQTNMSETTTIRVSEESLEALYDAQETADTEPTLVSLADAAIEQTYKNDSEDSTEEDR
jgi:hypothetical protein